MHHARAAVNGYGLANKKSTVQLDALGGKKLQHVLRRGRVSVAQTRGNCRPPTKQLRNTQT